MAAEPQALLLVEIGSVITTVTLVDRVNDETRVVAQASAPTSIDPPGADGMLAVLEATSAIAELTNRTLLRDGDLLHPQTAEQDGVDAVVVITSAYERVPLAIAAVSNDVSARGALHAAQIAGIDVRHLMTLNEGEGSVGDGTWLDKQIAALIATKPEIVLLAGGVERGATEGPIRLANLVALAAASRSEQTKLAVVYAGNSVCAAEVQRVLTPSAEVTVVPNVRPTAQEEQLEPTRRALAGLVQDRRLANPPGHARLQKVAGQAFGDASAAAGVTARFLAERYGRAVLLVDVGASATTAALQSEGRFSPVQLGNLGVGYGVGGVLAAVGPQQIARWLPFPIAERELVHRLLNKQLRPNAPPATLEALLLDLAVAREALLLTLATLREERPDASYDLVLASGSTFGRVPKPGFAALALLDALQPVAASSELAIELQLDKLGLVGVIGGLVPVSADAALTLIERDLLRHTPLGTCVSLSGSKRGAACEVTLAVSGGAEQRLTVEHGTIARLPLAHGLRGTLTLRPSGGVRIGRNAPGSEVKSEIAAIRGSELGVVIDARGQPLSLPADHGERQRLLWSWLSALGAVSGALPYTAGAPVEATAPDLADAPERASTQPIHTSQRRISLTPEPTTTAATIENDLAALRQTMAPKEEKKRGLFRR